MNFSQSAQLAQRLDWVESTGSTNSDLIAAAAAEPAAFPDFSVLVAAEQTAGRGRSGREWQAPAGSSLVVSVLLRPNAVAVTQFAWLPLIAGMSMANAISQFAGSQRAQVKWPNDVLIGDKKVCGVLSELLPDASAVVIGTGVNVFQSLDQLPTETATSLALEKIAIESLDDLLAAYLKNLRSNINDFIALAGELGASELHDRISAICASIGREVRVMLPNDKQFLGKAIAIDSIGRLVVQNESETRSVSVGDVVHLRHN
jgi:BirA family biotin operon repressor/biotin-[acetyl-CoA-carboxylase] ligase